VVPTRELVFSFRLIITVSFMHFSSTLTMVRFPMNGSGGCIVVS
jgi:hypothetical protein